MKITLEAPIVQQEEITVTEVEILRVVELYRQNKVVAFTNVGAYLLWEGDELNAINETTEQWTDDMVVTRLTELLTA